jgi:hypothetical protein
MENVNNFYIGQTFDGEYPPEAAIWCNNNNSHIEYTGETKEIEVIEEYIVIEDGQEVTKTRIVTKTVRVYKIVENPAPPQPTVEEILKGYEDAVQAHLDNTAKSRGYDNTYTCLSYLSSTDETWHREANAFNAWRDSVWRKCHEILNAFMAGEIAQPTVEELIEQLPVIDWGDNNA